MKVWINQSHYGAPFDLFLGPKKDEDLPWIDVSTEWYEESTKILKLYRMLQGQLQSLYEEQNQLDRERKENSHDTC